MGIQINGNTNNINAGIGSLSIEDINELDIVGVATAANFKTGVSNLHSLGLTLSGGQLDVGSNIKLGTAGVVTATSFSGSGANLTGISQVGGATGADFNDNIKIRFGASNDLQLFHATAGISTIMHFHSGGEPLHITSNGDIKFKVAADNTGGGGEDGLIIKSNGAVELYHNNNKKLESTSSGVTVTGGVTASTAAFSGEVDIADGEFLDFGNGGLKIRTNANNAYITEATSGKLEIAASNLQFSNHDASQTYAYFTNGGAATLYHAGTSKLETTSDGITITRNTSDTTMTNTSQLVLRNTNDGSNTFAGIRFEVSSNSATDHFIVQKKHSGGSGTDLIIGHGSNERIRFIESGGITFNGDTSSNNALDDYEQGDLTLTLVGTSGGSANYSYRTGHYTKIGNICHVTGDIRFNGAWSGSTGSLNLNLPFTAEATGGCVGAGIVSEWNLSGSNWDNIMIKVDNNESVARFTAHSGSNNNTSNFQTNLFGNGRYLKFAFTYQTQ